MDITSNAQLDQFSPNAITALMFHQSQEIVSYQNALRIQLYTMAVSDAKLNNADPSTVPLPMLLKVIPTGDILTQFQIVDDRSYVPPVPPPASEKPTPIGFGYSPTLFAANRAGVKALNLNDSGTFADARGTFTLHTRPDPFRPDGLQMWFTLAPGAGR